MIKKYLFIFILILSGHSSMAWAEILEKPSAAPVYQRIYLGQVKEDSKFLIYHARSYNLFRLFDTTYIPLTYLKQMGAEIRKADNEIKVNFDEAENTESATTKVWFKEKGAYSSRINVYIGNIRTYSIGVEDEVLVPVQSLKAVLGLITYRSAYVAEDRWYDIQRYITIDDRWIHNQSNHLLRLKLMHIIWDGKKFIEEQEDILLLKPYEIISKPIPAIDKQFTYVTTVLLSLNGFDTEIDIEDCYGQKNDNFFRTYTCELNRERLEKVFPAYKILGSIKQDMVDFKKGEKIEIWRAEKRNCYMIKTKEGKYKMLPCSSIAVEVDRGVYTKAAKKEDIEDYITLNHMTSKTDYLIWTDLYRQRVYVLKKAVGAWQLQKICVCSSGKNTFPTPAGRYELQYSIPYFGLQKNFRCKNALVFFRDYMFHSIIFDSTGTYIKSGKYQLGQRVSHGCVRLSEEDSAWLYYHIPLKTTVWIR